MHLSEGHPWRALPVILALWSPDFPHVQAFALHPRSLGLLTGFILSKSVFEVNKNLVFRLQKLYNKIVLR